jgi:hypothetical protein
MPRTSGLHARQRGTESAQAHGRSARCRPGHTAAGKDPVIRASVVALSLGLFVCLCIAEAACANRTQQVYGPGRPPDGRVLFGVHIDWSVDLPGRYAARSGLRPALYGDFVAYPLTAGIESRIVDRAKLLAAAKADLFLTLEPVAGLQALDEQDARELARTLLKANLLGVQVYVRFGQEMNGSWYIWGQRPEAYVRAFRTLAATVHQMAPGNAMVWSPNYAGGYPFAGGPYGARRGTADYGALDTNRDGSVTAADDPYSPFYPGDAYVDWVGLSLYHLGGAVPGENEVPEPDKFRRQLLGSYTGAGGDQRQVPNFYRTYAVGHRKPMAISETAALVKEDYSDRRITEPDIKCAWMGELFDGRTLSRLPWLKMVNWFEYKKDEPGLGGVVDWRATADPSVRHCLRAYLSGPRFVLAAR